MGKSTNSFKYTAMLACAVAILSLGPATAFAGDNAAGAGSINVTAQPVQGQESHGLVTDANLPVLMHPGSPRPEVESPRRLPFGYPPIPTGPL